MTTKKKIKPGIITVIIIILLVFVINLLQIPGVIRCEMLTVREIFTLPNGTA